MEADGRIGPVPMRGQPATIEEVVSVGSSATDCIGSCVIPQTPPRTSCCATISSHEDSPYDQALTDRICDFGLRGVLASLTVLFSGHTLAWPYKPVARLDSVLVLALSVVLTIATYPLATLKRRLDVPNRLCLVFAVLAFAVGALRDDQRIEYVWLSGCLGFCLLVRLLITAKRKNHHVAAKRRKHITFRQNCSSDCSTAENGAENR